MFVNEENVVFEACVQMWLESQLRNYWVMVAVYVGIDSVQPLEELLDQRWECLREGNSWKRVSAFAGSSELTVVLTDSARKHGFIVDIALNPSHQVLYILWRGHFGRPLEVFRVLP